VKLGTSRYERVGACERVRDMRCDMPT
jgi:hypothetical protein